MNRAFCSPMQAMLLPNLLPTPLWAEIFCTSATMRNIVTSWASPRYLALCHIPKDHSPTLAHHWVFDCKCWIQTMSPADRKSDNRSRAAVLLGHLEKNKENKQLCEGTRTTIVSNDETFDDIAGWGAQAQIFCSYFDLWSDGQGFVVHINENKIKDEKGL